MEFNIEIFFDDSIRECAENCINSLNLVEEISNEIILDSDEGLIRKTEGIDSSEDRIGVEFYEDGQQELLLEKFKELGSEISEAQEVIKSQVNYVSVKQLNNLLNELRDDLYYDSVTLAEMGELLPEIRDYLISLLNMCFDKDNHKFKQFSENKDLILHSQAVINRYLSAF